MHHSKMYVQKSSISKRDEYLFHLKSNQAFSWRFLSGIVVSVKIQRKRKHLPKGSSMQKQQSLNKKVYSTSASSIGRCSLSAMARKYWWKKQKSKKRQSPIFKHIINVHLLSNSHWILSCRFHTDTMLIKNFR